MYYLYLDESGHVVNYFDKHGNPQALISPIFTTGGIIIDDNEHQKFQIELNSIMQYYFGEVTLDPCFKLHYTELLQCKKSPYNILTKPQKIELADRIFNTISTLNCNLLSVGMHLDSHYMNQRTPIPHRVLALRYIAERFERYVVSKSDKGKIIYEQFGKRETRRVNRAYDRIFSDYNLPRIIDIRNVDPEIEFRDGRTDPVLPFCDFFTYATWKRRHSNYQKDRRWTSVSHKYYNLNHRFSTLKGNVEI